MNKQTINNYDFESINKENINVLYYYPDINQDFPLEHSTAYIPTELTSSTELEFKPTRKYKTDKKTKNSIASAKFRLKKKLKEQEMIEKIQELERVNKLIQDGIDKAREENNYLKQMMGSR